MCPVLHRISSTTLDTTRHVALHVITFSLRRFFKKIKQISIEEAINLSFEKKIPKTKKSKKSKAVKIDPLQIICRDLTFNKK